jgi:retinol dehydrogenase-12
MLNSLVAQIFTKPPYPTFDFTGQTILITGTNVGLGKEACKHFCRLNASRVIATVRNLARGKDALAEIEAETKRTGIVELWELDYGKYESVLAFGERAQKELRRLDKVVLNAGIATENWELLEGHESTITVNVISTALIGCLLLPVLRASKNLNGGEPALEVVCSGVHAYAKFKEQKGESIFRTMDDQTASDMADRLTCPSQTPNLQLIMA